MEESYPSAKVVLLTVRSVSTSAPVANGSGNCNNFAALIICIQATAETFPVSIGQLLTVRSSAVHVDN
jgi:hypothetical protein